MHSMETKNRSFQAETRAMRENLSPADIARIRESVNVLRSRLVDILAKHPGTDEGQVQTTNRIRRELWLHPESKRARYSLQAVIIDYLFEGIEEVLTWDKCSECLESEDPFQDLYRTLLAFFMGHLAPKMLKLEYSDDAKLREVYDLYDEFMALSVICRPQDANIASLFLQGMVTSAHVMLNILQIIPKLAEEFEAADIAPEQYAEIAAKSETLVIRIGMHHIKTFKFLMMELEGDTTVETNKDGFTPFDVSQFELVPHGNSYRVDLKNRHKIRKQLQRIETDAGLTESKVGCPAHVNFDGKGSAIARLWKILIDFAEHIYAHQSSNAAKT